MRISECTHVHSDEWKFISTIIYIESGIAINVDAIRDAGDPVWIPSAFGYMLFKRNGIVAQTC